MEFPVSPSANLLLRSSRDALTRVIQRTGISARVRSSEWRRRQLLILCYHGVALHDEHEWDPHLFVTPDFLRQRFDILRRGDYVVLGLAEAVERLGAGRLPPRSVCLTFDDGLYDFYSTAAPLLEEYGYPATVYLSTHYAVQQRPLRDLTVRYLLWRGRHNTLPEDTELGLDNPLSLANPQAMAAATTCLLTRAESLRSDRERQTNWFKRLADRVGEDWEDFLRRRMLHLMTMDEAAELARRGFNIQLHTHRHRTPRDETKFRQEITENRRIIERYTGHPATHFCYPSGDTDAAFIPWLKALGVESATTCAVDLARPESNPLLLPRFIDTMHQSTVRFESWLDGTASLMQFRRR